MRKWVSKSLLAGPKPSVVLLDLRLGGKDRDEIRVPVSETSGAWIARITRELDRGLPIVLMTASNKAHTFEAAMKLGIDAYWMKEGVGEHAPQGGSCRNYARLLELIAVAVGSQCQFLRRFSDQVEALKEKPERSLWWEGDSWIRQCGAGGSDREKVIDLLDGIVTLLREYLRLFAFGYGAKQQATEQGWLSALMVEAIKILELVHHLELTNVSGESVSLSKLARRRKDNWGADLNGERRFGAHALEGAYYLTFEHIQCVLAGVVTWLREDPRGKTTHVKDTDKYRYLKGDNAFDSVL